MTDPTLINKLGDHIAVWISRKMDHHTVSSGSSRAAMQFSFQKDISRIQGYPTYLVNIFPSIAKLSHGDLDKLVERCAATISQDPMGYRATYSYDVITVRWDGV
jgi:hypothetical protein